MSPQPTSPPDVAAPASRSGGPKTPEGKERSRRNALKHGLRAKVLTPDEMIDDVMNRTADFAKQFRPQNAYQEWLVAEIALATVRLDRCAALSIIDLQRRTNHAEPCWDLDRQRDVAALAARLKHDPARVLPALKATRHGVDWLILHWRGLASALETHGDWDDDQHRLAMDLDGVPNELRRRHTRLPESIDPKVHVQERLDILRALKESCLDAQDEDQRTQAGLGISLTADPMTANLQRYERSCRRALHWARTELARLQAEPEPDPEPEPEPTPEPIPTPPPPRDPNPPPTPSRNGFDLLKDRLSVGKPLPRFREEEALLAGDISGLDSDTLDMTIIPSRSAHGPSASDRRRRRRD